MNITCVACSKDFWEFVRQLRINPKVINGFLQTNPISVKDQIGYMEIYSQQFRIALIDGLPVGYFGVIENDIRICTHPDFQGMGVARFMLLECVKIWPTAGAKIKLGNIASYQLFISCGFEVISTDEKFTHFKFINNQNSNQVMK